MTHFVRVRLPNDREATLPAAFVDGSTLEVLDAPATNRRGVPLPATRRNGRPVKPRTTVSKEAAKKAALHESDPGPSDNIPGGSPAESAEEAPA
jgi:hypothetical protein